MQALRQGVRLGRKIGRGVLGKLYWIGLGLVVLAALWVFTAMLTPAEMSQIDYAQVGLGLGGMVLGMLIMALNARLERRSRQQPS